MPIARGTGNLLTAEVDALVNPVNTVGVMGKGLALQFKKAFPDCFTAYEAACRRGEVMVGHMHVVERLVAPRYIINFPTKKHWRQPSKLDYVREGLVDLVEQVQALKIESIAIPPLGCGNGGLAWDAVEPLILDALAPMQDVRVLLFGPEGTPRPDEVIDRRARPRMTPSRALLLASMARYRETGYDARLSLIELQKLAYFLQVAGEPLRLDYAAHDYGPYADNLRKALRNMEGHLTSGVGDGHNSPETPIEILPGALEEALVLIESREDSKARLERVTKLIEGFETPFGMELLASVHWVLTRHGSNELDEAVAGVHAWTERKRSIMKPAHIRAAWQRLYEQGWVGS